MNWVFEILASAFFLGIYDLCTKHAVRENAVTPVLFLSTVTGATVWGVLYLIQRVHPGILPSSLVTDPLTWQQHLRLVLKSVIVAASWVGTYFAMKHLPISLASPTRAMSPLLTFLGAVLILGERPVAMKNDARVAVALHCFIGRVSAACIIVARGPQHGPRAMVGYELA